MFGSVTTGAQREIFRGRRSFWEWGHFYKRFMCDTQKKGLTEKHFGVFMLLNLHFK